ncbi:MAG: VWA domain-containing protein, partial [Victivallales bacterium]|nr:VWA domain-containing protein [Victivallales bacterium]
MFTNLSMLNWLWMLPLLAVILIAAAAAGRRALKRIAGPAASADAMGTISRPRRIIAAAALFAALPAIIVALAGPAWNPVEEEVERQGRDVVFILDVSRSMLADDLKPNRLARAKSDIAECTTVLSGDRVALVAFAGNAAVQCPLTQDYGFFKMMLADTDENSVTRGGTAIGDAIRKAVNEVFTTKDDTFRDIILITDGEDHDSFPLEAAKAAGEAGIRIIAIGIGDDQQGTPIQVTDQYGRRSTIKYQGDVVRSKLDSETLRKMSAQTPGGVYLPVATNTFDLRQIYSQLIAAAERRSLETEKITRLQPKFQIFILAAMILMAVAFILAGRRSSAALMLSLLLCTVAHAGTSARQAMQTGSDLYRQGKFAEAGEEFRKALPDAAPEAAPYLQFNAALADIRNGQGAEAAAALEAILQDNAASAQNDAELAAECEKALAAVNFGNARSQLEQQQLQPALESAEKAAQHYKNALNQNPEDQDAKANQRQAQLLGKYIRYQLKQQQNQQNQQNQQ